MPRVVISINPQKCLLVQLILKRRINKWIKQYRYTKKRFSLISIPGNDIMQPRRRRKTKEDGAARKTGNDRPLSQKAWKNIRWYNLYIFYNMNFQEKRCVSFFFFLFFSSFVFVSPKYSPKCAGFIWTMRMIHAKLEAKILPFLFLNQTCHLPF